MPYGTACFTLEAIVKDRVREVAVAVVRMSRKNQIVVPREAREHLKLAPGDEVVVVPLGAVVVLAKKPRRPVSALAGVARGLFGDPTAFLREEAASWEPKDR